MIILNKLLKAEVQFEMNGANRLRKVYEFANNYCMHQYQTDEIKGVVKAMLEKLKPEHI